MDLSDYTKANLDSWNEVEARHAKVNKDLNEKVKAADFNNLNPDFDSLFNGLEIEGKSVVQVGCNNGIDLLSVKNKGAGRCLGIDGAEAFIEAAKKLAAQSGQQDIDFVCSNIYALPEEFERQFDVLVVTVGVINWMPDIAKFMSICASLLKDGGVMLMEEIHPILGMYEEASSSYIDASYFDTEPYKSEEGLDYFTHDKYQATENYWFQHTLDKLLMSALEANLQLLHIKELPYNVGNFCADLEQAENNPPMGINLAWRYG